MASFAALPASGDMVDVIHENVVSICLRYIIISHVHVHSLSTFSQTQTEHKYYVDDNALRNP